ncbi:hypothetical protein BG005_003446 [Podila minutissima]|nr:hypothetical protein BG005_003446 [Podila minutissima]
MRIATTLILCFGGIAAVAPLYVASEGVVCHNGGAQTLFKPGVVFKKQTSQYQSNGDLGVCSSVGAPKITGGTFSMVGKGYGKVMITWNTGETSVDSQASFRAEAFTASIEGQIGEGKFMGCTLRMNGRSTTSVIEMGAQCVTSGLTTYAWVFDAVTIECD